MRPRTLAAALVTFFLATGAFASWYDDYDAGLAAIRKGQWGVAAQKMSSAIAGNKKEDNHARTYGAIFINYHPYYYRGVANLNLGKYEQAVSDFEQASGPGEVDQGSIETLIQRAKSKLEASNTPDTPAPAPPPVPVPTRPAPVPVPVPVAPTPVPVPAGPQIDPGLRQQAANEISNARNRMTAAQQRRANAAPQYGQAAQQLVDLNTRLGAARTNDELRSIATSAQNLSITFDSLAAPTSPTQIATAPPTKPIAATNAVLGAVTDRVRKALDSYFRGDFEDASRMFAQLANNDLPKNGWIWAFYGASEYSRYAFETDEKYRTSAIDAFKKARKYGRNDLPVKYFSKRIRNAFDATKG